MDKNRKQELAVLIVFFSILIIATVLVNMNFKKASSISYNEFIKLVERGEVQEVIISFSSDKFEFIDKNGKTFETDNPRDTNFKKYLLEKNIDVSVIKIDKNC